MGDNTGYIVRCLKKNGNFIFSSKTQKHAYPMVNAIICDSFMLNPRLDAMMKQFHKFSNTLLARNGSRERAGVLLHEVIVKCTKVSLFVHVMF